MGARVGTIYVELDLDTKRWDGAQKRILNDARSVGIDVEKNFKNLGIKSEALYNMMRAQAINAFDGIKHSATSTANDIILAEKAKVAKLRQIREQERAQWEVDYKNLGVRSNAAIASQVAAVKASYKNITKTVKRGTDDWVRLEKAKNEKIKALELEMVGSHKKSMAGMARAALRLYAAYYVTTQAIRGLIAPIREGVQYLKTLETAELGMAASFATGGKFIDQTTQKALEGSDALMAAQRMSKSLVKELEFENIRTIATLDELVKAFQTALPVAMAKGFDTKQVKDFTVAMVQAAGAIGLPFDQMAEEIRSLLTGAINPRTSRIATVLGLRNEDVNKYKNNADELFNFLMGKLSAYKVAGIEAQKTWAGIWSNAKDIMDQFLGKATEPLFEAIKYEMGHLIDSVVTLNEETQKIEWNQGFLDSIDSIKSGINSAIIATYKLGMALDTYGGMLFSVGKFFGNDNSTEKFLEYQKRYLASEKAIMDLSMREIGFFPSEASVDGAKKIVTETGQILYYSKKIVEESSKYEQALAKINGLEETRKKAMSVKQAIMNLEWQISIIHKSAEEQSALNAVRAKGLTLDESAGKRIHDLTIELFNLKKAQDEVKQSQSEAAQIFEETRTPLEKLETGLEKVRKLYESGYIDEDTYLRKIGKMGAESVEATESAAKEIKDIWENTRDSVQDAIKGFFDSARQGEFESFKDMIGDLGDSAGEIFTARFSEQLTESLMGAGDLAKGFKSAFGDIFEGTGEEIAAGVLGTISAGISAVQSGNKYQMGGVALGAGIGSAFGPMGMAAGASIGGGLGGLLSDNEPSYFSLLRDSINSLVEQLKDNTQALKDTFLGVGEITATLRGVQDSVLNDTLPGMKGSLAEEMNLPGGMKKRKASGLDYVEAWTAEVAGVILSPLTGGLSAQIGGQTAKRKLDKGYTAYDMGGEQLTDTFTAIFDHFSFEVDGFGEKIFNVADAFKFFSESSEDAGVFMDKMVELGVLNPEIPQRVIDWYSDSKGSKNIELVSEGIAAILEEAMYSVLVSAKSQADSISDYMGSYDQSKLSGYKQALADIDNSLGAYKDEAKKTIPVLEALMGSGKLTTDELEKAGNQLRTLIGAEEDYNRVREETIESFRQARVDIFRDMASDLSIATGATTGMEQVYAGINSQTETYRNSLVDTGLSLSYATLRTDLWAKSMRDAALSAQLKTDSDSYQLRILQALGKDEEYLALTRKLELEAIEQLYGAGTEEAEAIIFLAETLWDAEDAATAASSAISGMANAMSNLDIASQVASIAGLSEKFKFNQIALDLGWFESGSFGSKSQITDLVNSVIGGSPQQIREIAESFGLTTDVFLDDVDYLNQGLQAITDSSTSAASAADNAADAIQSQADALKDMIDSVESLQGLIENIKGAGEYAPVQSMEYFELRYQQLLSEAQSGGSREVEVLTDFTQKYLDFAQQYGGDYSNVADSVLGDLESLEASIAGDKTLADLYAQLEQTNAELSAVRSNTGATAAGIADAIGATLSSLFEQETAAPWEGMNWDFDALLNQFRSGADRAIGYIGNESAWDWGQGWLGGNSDISLSQTSSGAYRADFTGSRGQDIESIVFKTLSDIGMTDVWKLMQSSPEIWNRWQGVYGYASGSNYTQPGWAAAGEEGLEFIDFPAGSKVYNHTDSMSAITSAVQKGLSGAGGGGGDVTVVIKIGDKTIKDFTAKTIRTHPEAQKAVRKVANG